MSLISFLIILIPVTVVVLVLFVKSASDQYEISSIAYYNCDLKKLWTLVTDFPNQTNWRTGIIQVEKVSDISGRNIWQETNANGQVMKIETLEYSPMRRLVRRLINENEDGEIIWIYDFAEVGEISTLKISEQGKLLNPILKLISKINSSKSKVLNRYFEDVANELKVSLKIWKS
ncbi:MAG: hypothetical protein FI687_02035 [SAR202 cluster bacterium]|nr:hypothetical protein [SAR202 cluster bacterium]|tara:strand:- start:49466 stop:49990 length:525 start_codon:yes stop_codon:yes gene_type:complete